MQNIVLVGFMGTGKTTVGRLLAEQMGMPLVDMVTPYSGVELFATIRELDSTGVAGSQSVDITAIGSRIKF